MKRWSMGLMLPLLIAVAGCPRISEEKEMRIGRQAAQVVERAYPLSDNGAYQERVRRIGEELTRHAQRKVDYTFQVVKAKEQNAFALHGGPIYVTTGLMEMNLTDDQLAGVLAHEISHVEGKHFVKLYHREEHEEWAKLILVVATGGKAANLVRFASVVHYMVQHPRWSRRDETDADRGAVPLMFAAGRDPHQVAEVFRTWKQQGKIEYADGTNHVTEFPLSASDTTALAAHWGDTPQQDNQRAEPPSGLLKRTKSLPPSVADSPPLLTKKDKYAPVPEILTVEGVTVEWTGTEGTGTPSWCKERSLLCVRCIRSLTTTPCKRCTVTCANSTTFWVSSTRPIPILSPTPISFPKCTPTWTRTPRLLWWAEVIVVTTTNQTRRAVSDKTSGWGPPFHPLALFSVAHCILWRK